MTTTTPVYDAITIARLAIKAALTPLVAALQADGLAVRLAYLRMPVAATLPYCVHQDQSGGGRADNFLNMAGWSGLWTVKVFATDIDTADAWLASIRTGLDAPALPTGYTTGYSLMTEYDRPIVLPPSENLWQSAAIWRVRIYRA